MSEKNPSSGARFSEILTLDEGVVELHRRINDIFLRQNVLAVAINSSENSSEPKAGRSRLSTLLTEGCVVEGTPIGICNDPSHLRIARDQVYRYQETFEQWIRQVYIFTAWDALREEKINGCTDVRKNCDMVLGMRAGNCKVDLKKVDLWVRLVSGDAVFAPDNKPSDFFEDVFIRH